MGWDNASTIATEVERPQRTYPRAMLVAAGLFVLMGAEFLAMILIVVYVGAVLVLSHSIGTDLGMWAPQVAAMVGAFIPSTPVDHQHIALAAVEAFCKTVDKTKPAAASEAPAGVKVIGPVIQTPTTDPAPDLTLHAPELIRVSAKTRLLRFIVFSSGDGTLRATLGSTWLGRATSLAAEP